MPVRSTELYPGEFYHVYNRGANGGTIYFARENYMFFLRRFREKVSAEHATTLAYCLMPNHFHLLIRLNSNNFSERMQSFGTSYSKAINKQIGRSGALFQGRFQAKHVDEIRYLVHLSRYVHLNPVEAKLASTPGDWEFSSYRDYIGARAGTLPVTGIVLREFNSQDHYRKFVEDRAEETVSIKHLLFDE